MDADVPRIPEKQVLIARGDQHMDEDIKKINEIIRIRKARGTITYGPIAAMDLGTGWKDLGVSVFGGRPAWRVYRHEEPRCTLRVPLKPENHHRDTTDLIKRLISATTGTVPTSEWHELSYLFGEAGNPQFYTVHSVELAEFGGKKVIVMTGQDKKGNQARGKHVYVSLSGDWTDSYELVFGSSVDKAIFDKQLAKFDEALRTVIWKKE